MKELDETLTASGASAAFGAGPRRHLQEMRHMKRTIGSILSICALAAATWSSVAATADASAIDAVKQVGKDMGDAMVALDVKTLDRIFADEWMTIGMSGDVYTKERMLRDIGAGRKKLVSYRLGPMDVQVFGDVAIVLGSVAERRITDTGEKDMTLVYSDILRKRDGRWVVVRSIGSPTE